MSKLLAPTLSESEHVVQFYEAEEFLVEAVCGLITAALSAGDGVLACITEPHQRLVAARLESRGIDLPRAIEQGQCVILSSDRTLSQIFVNGSLSTERFNKLIGGAISTLTQGWPRVQACGELVAVLCEAGNCEAASQIEELWHQLIGQYPHALLCLYPLKLFASRHAGMSVSQVCQHHTRVIPAESFSGLDSAADQLLAVTTLQQKALALELEITARERAERERALLAALVNSSDDAIVSKNLDGIVTSWNRSAELLFGYTAEEMIGSSIVILIPPDRVSEEQEIIRKIASGERIRHFQTLRRRKDGSLVDISLAISPIRNSQGQITGASKIARDITEQVQVLKELERANRAAEKANKTKSAFLANISHELRTPMTAVLGFAEMLRSESTAPGFIEKVDSIARNGKYLLALLDDVLDLSVIEADKLAVAVQAVDVPQTIEDVRSLMNVRAVHEGIPLVFVWDTAIPQKITADRIRLRQILVNLIGNAIKFTDEGEVRVTVRLDAEQTRLLFEVSDTGIGMTPEQMERIFQPFTQASLETAQRFGGTGLGLTISKRLADAMGSSIDVTSEFGQGSCFTLSLPVTKAQCKHLAQPGATRPAQASASQEPRPTIDARILLADDRRDVWRVGKYFLEGCGAQVTVVEDGRQAVDTALQAEAEGRPFSLILMDMQMPVMNGREAVQELRAQGFDQPIVALTADAMAGDRQACLQIGCTEYLAKPIDAKKLIALVVSLLGE